MPSGTLPSSLCAGTHCAGACENGAGERQRSMPRVWVRRKSLGSTRHNQLPTLAHDTLPRHGVRHIAQPAHTVLGNVQGNTKYKIQWSRVVPTGGHTVGPTEALSTPPAPPQPAPDQVSGRISCSMGPNYENRLPKGQPYITSETLQSEVSRWIFLPLRMVDVPNQAGYFETEAPCFILSSVSSDVISRQILARKSNASQRCLFWYVHRPLKGLLTKIKYTCSMFEQDLVLLNTKTGTDSSQSELLCLFLNRLSGGAPLCRNEDEEAAGWEERTKQLDLLKYVKKPAMHCGKMHSTARMR